MCISVGIGGRRVARWTRGGDKMSGDGGIRSSCWEGGEGDAKEGRGERESGTKNEFKLQFWLGEGGGGGGLGVQKPKIPRSQIPSRPPPPDSRNNKVSTSTHAMRCVTKLRTTTTTNERANKFFLNG